MGLERIASVLQEANNIFEIDAIHAILEDICAMANYEYGTDKKKTNPSASLPTTFAPLLL